MNKTRFLILITLTSALVGGCTDDPHKGGIFWSERGSQERLHRKNAELDAVESDTDRLNSSSARRRAALGY